MDVFGRQKVLFKTSGKPGEKDNYYDLPEGMGQDDIMVKKIDEKAGMITFDNHGTEQQIALVTQSSGGGGGNGGGGSNGGGGMPGRFGGNTGFRPGGGFNGGGGGSFHSYGGSNPGGQNGFNNGNNVNGGYNGGGTSGGINLDGHQLSFGGTSYSGTRSTTTLPPDGMTAEQQALIIEVNRAQTQDQVNSGELPPLPPTMITPPGATAAGGVPLGGNENTDAQ